MAGTHIVLLRGINVGGKNKVPMAELRDLLGDLGFEDVQTYIQTGNIVLRADASPAEVRDRIQTAIPERFAVDSALIRALVLTPEQYRATVDGAPAGFGDDLDAYRCDVAFLIDVTADDVMDALELKPEVDEAWPGTHAVYWRRLSARASSSRITRITQHALYQSLTVRNWNTTTKLLAMLDDRAD